MKVFKPVSALLLAGSFLAGGAAYSQTDALQELKERCAELSANQQLRPFTVSITCRQEGMVWKETAPTYMDIDNGLQISATIRVKQFLSELVPESVVVAATPAACTVLEQFHTQASVDLELTCAEIDAIDNLGSYCYGAIQNRIEEFPDQYVEESTGQLLNTCDGFQGAGVENLGVWGQK